MSWRTKATLWAMAGILFATPGCSSRDYNIIEEIAPIILWTIDQGQDGMLEISLLVPPLGKEEKKMITLHTDLLKEGKKEFNRSYHRELKTGQKRVLFISEEFARQGMQPIIDTILADPKLSMRLYLAVYRGDLQGYLQKKIKKDPLIDYYIYRNFKHYESRSPGEMTVVNLHQFMKNFYSPLADPVLPVFQADQNNLTYEGTGLFRTDKLVSVLSRTEEQMFQLQYKNHRLQDLSLPELSVNVSDVHAKSDWKVDRKQTRVTINTEIRCRIEEYHGKKDLLDPAQLDELNRNIGAYMDKQTVSLFKKMQELKVDPLNMGSYASGAFQSRIERKDWQKEWPQMKVEVHYKTFMEPLTNSLSGSR